jgi:hypothetical protein
MVIDFRSRHIEYFEKSTGKNIYSIIGYSTSLAIDFLCVATGVFEEEKRSEVADFLDEIKKEHGGIRGVVDYLIDLCDEEGFFTYLTGAEVKKILKEQEAKLKKEALLSEEEKKAQLQEMIMAGLKELKATGSKSGN